MTFLFPFNKEDGSAFSEQSEFEELLKNQKFGQFGFNPSNLSWHGGVHFTAENAPWLKDERPLQAMMDGRIVACRISSQYLSSQFNEHELQYSGDYCLLQHQVEDPKHSGSFFTFYALYMHLAPLCLEHRTFSDFPRYRLLSNRNARLDVGLSGTAFELGINAIIEATPTSPIIKDGYQFKQFTVIRSQVESLKDKTVWLAVQKESKPNDVRSLFLNRAELLGAEKENSSSYLLLKSARTYWLEPNIESPKATLNANTLLQESELSPVRCGDYEMRAYERINYGVGLDSSCVKTGEVIWFVTAKYEALENLFPNFAESYNPPSWLMTKVVAKIKVTGLQGRADPRYDGTKLIAGGKAYEVPKGTIIMFDKTRDWSFQKIGQKMRLMAKCRFHPNTPIIDLRGQAVPYLWICVEDEYIEPQQSYGLELDTTHCFGNQSSLFVKAGDDIGYLGRYDVTSIQENEPPVTTRYQVHFELLSSEPPPQFFIDMFLGKQEPDTETPYRIIEDYSNCDGYLNLKDEPSSFFKKLNEVYEKEEYQVKSTDIVKNFTAWDSCKNVIAKHESEWAKPASEKSFLDKLIKIVNNPKFDTLIEHEKERIDKLIWLPDVKKLGLENDVWNWWPICGRYLNNAISDDEMDTKWLTVPKGQLTFDSEGNDIDNSPFFTRKAHVPNNRGHVIGNSGVTIGRGLDLGNPPSGASGQRPTRLDLAKTFKQAGLNPKLSSWLLSTKGKTKTDALRTLNSAGLTKDELIMTRKQQCMMFIAVYAYMEEKTRILITKPSSRQAYGNVNWDRLPRKIQEVLTDLTYRGDNSPRTRSAFIPVLSRCQKESDYSAFKNIFKPTNSIWQQVPPDRRIKRYGHL